MLMLSMTKGLNNSVTVNLIMLARKTVSYLWNSFNYSFLVKNYQSVPTFPNKGSLSSEF